MVASIAPNPNDYPYDRRIDPVCYRGYMVGRQSNGLRRCVLARRYVYYHLGLEKTETAKKAIGYGDEGPNRLHGTV